LNIAFVLREFSTRGGTERYAVNLARWLLGRGHEVHVYASSVDRSQVPSGLVVHDVPRSKPKTIQFIRRTWGVGRLGHDVVQGFGRTVGHDVYRAGGGVHAAWLDASGDTLYPWLRARLSPAEWLENILDRRAARGARIVICNSHMAAAQVCAYHGVEEQRVRVIRNGVNTDRFRPRPQAREALRARWGARGRVLAFIGNGFRRKGLLVAGRAFAKVAKEGDRFVVIGRDRHAERYLAPVREIVGERLLFRGEVPDPEQYIAAADATVLPTLYDAAANTTLEALACGVPPVTSDRDGNAEIVPDRRLVVSHPEDVDEVSQAIRVAWGELGWVDRCRRVAETWTVARNGRDVEAVYRECIHGR
jgi:UDP-glucose:(heptosyl)LPS alpha-1,3-glucosyltransferase